MKIQFILVEPGLPENIGASARAIKTMGFDTLCLVKPCEWKTGKSRRVAHGSADILDNASLYESLKESLKGSDLSVATSSKYRTVKQDWVRADELYSFIESKSESVKNISIVFGREESGLTNDEIRLCDIKSGIVMDSPYPSLNLAQAVMIYAYELSGLNKNIFTMTDQADEKSFSILKIKIRKILSELGINEHDNRYGRIMERISFLKDDDIHLVHSVCNSILESLSSIRE
jgi:tRNA/rRNA methyltransferase